MKNVLEYLEISANCNPDKIAVAYRDERYSFGELRYISRRIGADIRSNGFWRKPIGVIAGRNIQTIVMFFGILYSGNFYVPIDPDMPSEKMQSILDDAQFPMILGVEKDSSIVNALRFDGIYLPFENIGQEFCEIPVTMSDTPAYMVYTSGSTGKPKGVLKSHGAIISYVDAFVETFGLASEEIIGNQTPFFFDASAKDIYLMLKLGCTLEILPSSLFMLPPELIDYLNERKVTYASWVPTVLSLVAQLNPFSMVKPQTLKRVFFVGEVMPMKHLNKWREELPDIQYVNLYGQSELAGVCCYYEVNKTFDNSTVLPMGKTLPNCKIYLVADEQIVKEPGQIGELYLVSDALALEYYNDPEKTNASFLMRDFGDGMVRCFKTGDLAQFDADGNLVFASRTDSQIKHMGHRIELGEIEAVAGSLPEIQRCCCLYQANKRKIILFCQLVEGIDMNGQGIRSLLRPKLSDYMLPGKVVILEALPLNANGKIDRQKLKATL